MRRFGEYVSELSVHISLCRHLFWCDGLGAIDGYVPGQELVDAVDLVVGDAFEDVVKIELGVEAVEFG